MRTKKASAGERRVREVLAALDRLAMRDALAAITTRAIVQESGVPDGVLFRHFPSKQAILAAWVHDRGERLRRVLDEAPPGRVGLLRLVRRLLAETPELAAFLCCRAVDEPELRAAVEEHRDRLRRALAMRIELAGVAPEGAPPQALADHLFDRLCRAWRGGESAHAKEELMRKLPWEERAGTGEELPSQEALARLAISDTGFVFDPLTGKSFTANETGLFILRFLQKRRDLDALVDALVEAFDVAEETARRDALEFVAQLRRSLG